MSFYWARSNKFPLTLLAIAVAIVGVLTILVMHQQHDQSTVDGQVHLKTAPTVSAAGADIMATANAATHPNPATTPDSSNAAVGRRPHQHPPRQHRWWPSTTGGHKPQHARPGHTGAVDPDTAQTENSASSTSEYGSRTPSGRGAPGSCAFTDGSKHSHQIPYSS